VVSRMRRHNASCREAEGVEPGGGRRMSEANHPCLSAKSATLYGSHQNPKPRNVVTV
jgi:hypothetical protein